MQRERDRIRNTERSLSSWHRILMLSVSWGVVGYSADRKVDRTDQHQDQSKDCRQIKPKCNSGKRPRLEDDVATVELSLYANSILGLAEVGQRQCIPWLTMSRTNGCGKRPSRDASRRRVPWQSTNVARSGIAFVTSSIGIDTDLVLRMSALLHRVTWRSVPTTRFRQDSWHPFLPSRHFDSPAFDPTDWSPPRRRFASHVCKSLWSRHPCGTAVSALSVYRSQPPTDG